MTKEDSNSIIVAVIWAFPSIFIGGWIGRMVGVGSDSIAPWLLATYIWIFGVWLVIKIFKWE